MYHSKLCGVSNESIFNILYKFSKKDIRQKDIRQNVSVALFFSQGIETLITCEVSKYRKPVHIGHRRDRAMWPLWPGGRYGQFHDLS